MTDPIAEGGNGAPDLHNAPRRKALPDTRKVDRLPPHSPEAEQGVLGCILLAPNDCMGECIEKFSRGAEVFYDLRHQTIFTTLAEMYDAREAIDLITLQQRLKNRQILEEVGGIAYLSGLADTVPSAANLSYYLEIVQEKYLLRKMIHTCTSVVGRVYDFEGEVDMLMDEVERDILRISESRVQAHTTNIKDLVKKAINTIEDFHQRQGLLTGIGTGFVEFDKMTSGLHGGEMIVIAARPSMGKCLAYDSEILLADGSLTTIEQFCQHRTGSLLTLAEDLRFKQTTPSAFVDDGRKPVFRVVTRLGRTVEATAPHPFLTPDGWKKLSTLKTGDAIAVPRRLNVFGRDIARECEVKLLGYLLGGGGLTHHVPGFTSGNSMVSEDFSAAVAAFGGVTKCSFDSNATRAPGWHVHADRELPAVWASPVSVPGSRAGADMPPEEHFHRLGEVLSTDAVPLASPGIQARSANSQDAVTLWLARLGLLDNSATDSFVPSFVFTLCQTQVALFLNCLFASGGWASVFKSGEAQLGYSCASEKLARQIQHLLLRFGVIASLKAGGSQDGGEQRTAWQLEITDDPSIQAFLSEIGLFGKERATAAVQSALQKNRYQPNRDPWPLIARGEGATGRIALFGDPLANRVSYLRDSTQENLEQSDIYWDEIVSIESAGRKQVYDLTIAGTHNFVANDLCVHNTSLAMNIAEHVAIEQKLPVGVFSLEMTSESLVLRMLCSRSRVNLRNVREGFLAERDFPKLTGSAGKLANAPLFIDDSSGLSVLQLRAKARRMFQQYGIKLFVIDYLQLLHSTARRAENRQQEIADISNGVKSLAKELNVPVIVLSQLNRELERDKNRKPRLSDLRESGAIEQDADLVGLLYKPSSGDDEDAPAPQEEEAVAVNLLIAKQRNGPTGDVNLTFLKSYTRFESAAKISDEDVQG